MGIMSIGCVTAPIYHSNTNEQVFYIADQSNSVFAFVENQEQLDKMLAIWDRLPNINQIVVMDHYHPTDLPNVCSLDDFIKLGQDYGKKHPDQFEDAITASQPDDTDQFYLYLRDNRKPQSGDVHQPEYYFMRQGIAQSNQRD